MQVGRFAKDEYETVVDIRNVPVRAIRSMARSSLSGSRTQSCS